jgi:hypothetical protein
MDVTLDQQAKMKSSMMPIFENYASKIYNGRDSGSEGEDEEFHDANL